MEKTKLGLPVAFMSAMVFALYLFGGYTVALLVFGYVMLCEKDESLRVSALTGLLLMLAVSTVNLVIGLLPDLAGIMISFFSLFDIHLNFNALSSAASILYGILSLLKTAAFVVLTIMALIKKPLQLPFIKKLLG